MYPHTPLFCLTFTHFEQLDPHNLNNLNHFFTYLFTIENYGPCPIFKVSQLIVKRLPNNLCVDHTHCLHRAFLKFYHNHKILPLEALKYLRGIFEWGACVTSDEINMNLHSAILQLKVTYIKMFITGNYIPILISLLLGVLL